MMFLASIPLFVAFYVVALVVRALGIRIGNEVRTTNYETPAKPGHGGNH